MTNKKPVLIIVPLVLILVVGVVFYFNQNPTAIKNNPEIFTSSGVFFQLTAPERWVNDVATAKSLNLPALYHLQGEDPKTALTSLYVGTVPYGFKLGDSTIKDLNTLIRYDTENYKVKYSDAVVADLDNILITGPASTTEKAIVKSVMIDSARMYDQVAFINASTSAIYIVLASKDKEELSKYTPAFESLVKSYFFVPVSISLK